MNRLILIGNGFDLAHGLKTGYGDFLLDLFKTELLKTTEESFKKRINGEIIFYNRVEGFFEIKIKNLSNMKDLQKAVEDISCFDELHELLEHQNRFISIAFYQDMGLKYIGILKETFDNIRKEGYSWVNIEGTYYDLLKKKIIGNAGSYTDRNIKEIKYLNSELDFLRERLTLYLKKVMDDKSGKFSGNSRYFWDDFKGEFINGNIEKLGLKKEDQFPNQIHILNFNYTNTIDYYSGHTDAHENKRATVECNFIHGEIKRLDTNPLIFGYGDETDDSYNAIEKLNNNELLRHVKSFGYFKTENYHRLLRFIEQPEGFQVFIVGHSCGLSDRVMLKRIFEHERCKAIRIFFHLRTDGSDDYLEKTQEVSRHFDNKNKMRARIVPKCYCTPLSELHLLDC